MSRVAKAQTIVMSYNVDKVFDNFCYLFSGIELLHPWTNVTMIAQWIAKILRLAALRERTKVIQITVHAFQLKINTTILFL